MSSSKQSVNESQTHSVAMMSILLEGIPGGLAGLLTYSLMMPLDVMQTRLQSTIDCERIKKSKHINFSLPFHNKSMLNTQLKTNIQKYYILSRDIYTKDGWKGFYKGYVPVIIGVIPSRFIYFSTNMYARKIFENYFGINRYETSKIAISAVMGSIMASTMTCPIWVIKTHLQLKRKLLQKHINMRHVCSDIYKNHGIRGFYRGLTSSYYGSIETMFYWLLYEYFKENIPLFRKNHNNEPNTFEFLQASFYAKTLSILFGYPHEVARTRMRQSIVDSNGKLVYNKFWTTLYKIYTQEGFHVLYSGLQIHLFRQVITATITMVLFEKIRQKFHSFV